METALRCGLAMLVALSSALASPQTPEDPGSGEAAPHWSSWRGPLGTGFGKGSPPSRWAEATETTPATNIAWKVPLPGLGISSPVIWGDRIYLTTAVKTDRRAATRDDLPPRHRLAEPRPEVVFGFAVIALNRTNGAVIWQKTVAEETPHEGGHRTNSFASSSPVTDGERIYVNFGSRGLYCLDARGEVLWSRRLGVMQTRRQYGEATSPALYGDHLVVNWDHEGDSFIVVLDKRTGEELWRRSRDEVTSWSTPIVVEVDGRPQVIINATTASRGYDLKTGEVIWRLSGMTVNCIPIHANGMVYLMSGYRGQALQAVRLAGARGDLAQSPNLVWSHGRNTSYVPSAALYNQRLYFVRGNTAVLSCLNAATGEVLYEGQRLRGLRQIYASPVCADGRVYITSRDGVTVVVEDGPAYKQLALNQLDDEVDASPAIIGDRMYIRGRRHLYCIAETGQGDGAPREASPPAPGADGHLQPVGSLGTNTNRSASVSAGDLDGDGDMDLVVANGRHWPEQNLVFLNDGDGRFLEQHPLDPSPTRSYAAALGDMDGDGDLDAVVGNDRSPSYVMLNDGRGRFTRGATVGKSSNTRSVTLADLDGKNGLDVVFTNRREPNLICFNDGQGGFERQQTFGAATDATIKVAAGDVDGDGDLDLAVANRNGQQNHVYLNDGAGGFSSAVPYGTGSDRTRGVAFADMDGDGHLDILNANIGEPNGIYFGDGSGRFPRSARFGPKTQSYAIAAGDLNGDGQTDIAVGNARGPNAAYLGGPNGGLTRQTFGVVGAMTYGVLMVDWEGGGRSGVITANSGELNHLYRWR